MSWTDDQVDLDVELYNRLIVCQSISHKICLATPQIKREKTTHLDISSIDGIEPIRKYKRRTKLDWMSNYYSNLVQVKLELGHRAVPRAKNTMEGHTHDWCCFVRGPEGCNIQHFIEKVVFNLHPTFPKPKRVCKEPPYQVSESGYASFNIEIVIHFKNKSEPKKIPFMYDLFLKTDDVVNHVRCEKLTFQNPPEDFRRRLLKSGGFGIPTGGNTEGTVQYEGVCSKTTLATSPKQAPPPPPPPVKRPPTDSTFTDLFGDPILKEDQTKKKKPIKTEKKELESPSAGSTTSVGSTKSSSNSSSAEKSSKSSKPQQKPDKHRSHSHSKESSSKSESSSSKSDHVSSKEKERSGEKHSSSSDRRSSEKHVDRQSSERADKHSSSSKSATKRPHDNDDDSRDSFSTKKKKKKEKEREKEREREQEKEKGQTEAKKKEERKSTHSYEKQKSSKEKFREIYSDSDSDSADSDFFEKEREKEKERKRQKEKEAELKKERERAEEKEKQRQKEAEKQKEKERELERQKEKEAERQRRKEREAEKQKAKEKELERQREKDELEKKRQKEKEEEKERERQKQIEREKEKLRELEKQRKEQEAADKRAKEKEEQEKLKAKQDEKKRRKQEKERARQKEREREKEKQREKELEQEKEKQRKEKQEREQREKLEKERKEKEKRKQKERSKSEKSSKDRKKSDKNSKPPKKELSSDDSSDDDDVIHVKTEKSPPTKQKSPRGSKLMTFNSDLFTDGSSSDPFDDNGHDSDSDKEPSKEPAKKAGGDSVRDSPKPPHKMLSEIESNSSESMDDDDILSPDQAIVPFQKSSTPIVRPSKPDAPQVDVIASKPYQYHKQKVPSKPRPCATNQDKHPPKKMNPDIFTDDSEESALSSDSSSSDSEGGEEEDKGHLSSEAESDHNTSHEREDGEIFSPVKVKKEPELLPPPTQARDGVIKRTGSDTNERAAKRQATYRDVFGNKDSTVSVSQDLESPTTPIEGDNDRVLSRDQKDPSLVNNRPNGIAATTPMDSLPQNDSSSSSNPNLNAGLNKDNVNIYKDTAPNGEVLAVLLDLQRQLALLTNKQILQHVVRIIMEAGAGTVSKSSFDFDLCKLDSCTLKKIQTYINESVA